ncbi:hypothetical protein ACFL38_02795 [Candidatus Omnitrophota bacterium]
MDSLTITIIFIIATTILGAFISGRMKDKCLKDLIGDTVHLELKDGKVVWGALQLEATGFELNYKESYLDKSDDHIESSFLLYKHEYPTIHCIARFIEDLDGKQRKQRDITFRKLLRQRGVRRLGRRIRNFFATVRDSVMEVVNLFMGRMKQVGSVGKVMSGRDKYVSKMQEGVFSSLNTSYEPLLEKHLGRKVIIEIARAETIVEYPGILRRYTAEFIELMDVEYSMSNIRSGKADIVVPRSLGIVRHFGE